MCLCRHGPMVGAIKALTVIGTNSNYLIKSRVMSANVRRLPTLPIWATLLGCDSEQTFIFFFCILIS